MPKVGPNYGIISDYMKTFREERGHSRQYCDERLVVEKIRPDGYLILNGHHRWAAALRLGFSRIPIEIVDLTDETDIREILKTPNTTSGSLWISTKWFSVTAMRRRKSRCRFRRAKYIRKGSGSAFPRCSAT